MGGRRVAALMLLAACATSRFQDAVDLDGHALRPGMTTGEVTRLVGPPDYVNAGAHKFAWRFAHADAELDPAWAEWVWYRGEDDYYVLYVSDGAVQRVGHAWDSPVRKDDCWSAIG